MKLGNLVIAGMCGMVGLVAGRLSVETNLAAAAPAPPQHVVAVPIAVPAIVPTVANQADTGDIAAAPGDTAADPDDTEGRDMANILADAKLQADALARTHETIRGRITDPSGQGLAGVTLIATGATISTAVAITDEHGDYEITGLPSASYLVTLYYGEVTIEYPGIATQSFDVTALDMSFDPNPTRPDYEEPLQQDDYIVNIPVPGRTFEAALGAAAGSQDDSLGISFTGVTSLENQYVVGEE